VPWPRGAKFIKEDFAAVIAGEVEDSVPAIAAGHGIGAGVAPGAVN